jgi:putative ABC transport system permease protein
MSVGLTAALLIFMYVWNELSYDNFHAQGDDIYRVVMEYQQKDESQKAAQIVAAVGPSLAETFPAIKAFVRTTTCRSGFFETADKILTLNKIIYADSSFLDAFSFKLLAGNKKTALAGENRIILTQKTAEAFFGSANPLGRLLRYNNKTSFTVTGIIADAPENSHIQYDAIISFSTLYLDKTNHMDWNGGNQYPTYILMQHHANPKAFQAFLPKFLDNHINRALKEYGVKVDLHFEPLKNIHLLSEAGDGEIKHGSIANILLFSAIATFILLIACFNFTNLSTAIAMHRAKETGIRKVCGADRSSLIRMYLAEAVLLSLIAMFISLILIELVQPWYNALLGMNLSIYGSQFTWFLPAIILLVILTGIFAGAYPAFYLSAFKPIKVLKGGFDSAKGKAWLPKVLVVIQFIISITLINCSWIILKQLDYLKSYDKGFDTSQVIAIGLPSQNASDKCALLQNELKNLAGVLGTGACSEIPGGGFTSNGYLIENEKTVQMIHVVDVDAGLLPTLGIPLKMGRNFVEGLKVDETAIIINERFAKKAGWDNAIGKKVYRDGPHTVIGVVKDFNYAPLHETIDPLIITQKPFNGYSFILLKFTKTQHEQVLAEIEKTWVTLFPSEPFHYEYVTTYLENCYAEESFIATLFSWFAGLAVFVACLGLFGLSSFAIQRRQREIGIRMVLGATHMQILRSLTADFVVLVVIAIAIATPLSWLLLDEWLQNFSYALPLDFLVFVLSGLAALCIVFATIGWQAVRAARTRVVEVLKYE